MFWISAFGLLLLSEKWTDTFKLLYALDINTNANSLICGGFFPKTDLCSLQLKEGSRG